MYKSIKLAMVMAIVIAVSGCIVAVSDENDAAEYTEISSAELAQHLSADGNRYELTGSLKLAKDVTIDKPVSVKGNLDLNINQNNVSKTSFIIDSGSTLTISGTAASVSFDIDGGTLTIDSNLSLTGTMGGGTINNNAKITIKTAFTMSGGQIINNNEITNVIDSTDTGSRTITNNGTIFEYTKTGDELSLTKVQPVEGKSFTYPLPKTIDGCNVTSIGDNAFKDCIGVTSVTSTGNNHLTAVGEGVFSGCSNLEIINFTKVTEIGDGAFAGCISLNNVMLASLTSVSSGLFEGCTNLEKLTVSTNCDISPGTFAGHTGLEVIIGTTNYFVDPNGNLTQANSDNSNFVIHSDKGDFHYLNLATAVTEATSGSTITMLKDTTIEPILIEKATLTLDLGGNELTISGGSGKTFGIDFSGANLTIANGDIKDERDSSRTGGYTAVNSAGNLNIENVDLVIYDASNTGDSNNIGYRITNGQTLTMSGNSTIKTNSTTDADRGSVGVVVLGVGNLVNTTNLILEDEVSIEVGQYGISGNGTIPSGDNTTDFRGTTITIMDNAKVSAVNGWGIYHPQDGTLNIQDNASVTGLTGIEIRSGKLSMTGGTVESTANGGDTLKIDSASGGATTVGVGIAVVQHTTKLDIAVDVTGGDVSGYYAVFQGDVAGNGDESAQRIDITLRSGNFKSTGTEEVIIGDKTYTPSAVYGEQKRDMVAGGSYNTDVSDYVAEGCEMIQNPDGTFDVVSEEESQPPSYDDDELPPFIPSQSGDSDDDTVTIVACAAAAAVAAIMAVFLIIDRKR